MLNVQVERINGILVTTSNRVAEELGVEHKHLLEKIDDYLRKFNSAESSAELSAQFYIASNYISKNGRTVRNYLITKKGIAQLIGGYSAAVERAFELNVAYINKFEEMEKALSSRQLPLRVPVSYDHTTVRTFDGVPVMEIKLLYNLTEFSKGALKIKARKIGAPVIRGKDLVRYKRENKEDNRMGSALIILYKEQVIIICKSLGLYEELKDIIENYFKMDNRIEYEKETKTDINDKYWSGIYETMKEAQKLESKIEKIYKEELSPLYDHIIKMVGAKKTMLIAFNCMKYGNAEGIVK